MQAFGNADGKVIVPLDEELDTCEAWIIKSRSAPAAITGILAVSVLPVITSDAAGIFAASPN